MSKLSLSLLIWIAIIHTLNGYSIHRSNKRSPSNGYSAYRRQQNYDIYDMVNDNNNPQHDIHHKYQPYYFSRGVFPALFGYKDIMDIDDSSSEESTSEYSDRSQLVALLLTIFLGDIGVGRFYVGEYIGASLKLILGLLTLCVICCWWAGVAKSRDLTRTKENLIRTIAELDGDEEEIGVLVATIRNDNNNNNNNNYSCGLILCLVCVVVIWWAIDICLFAINDIHDSDGLYPIPL